MPREVTDDAQRITWSCVQAFAGLGGDAARDAAVHDAAERVAGADGRVALVCTPSGGAQSVRLALVPDWESALSDAELRAAIHAAA